MSHTSRERPELKLSSCSEIRLRPARSAKPPAPTARPPPTPRPPPSRGAVSHDGSTDRRYLRRFLAPVLPAGRQTPARLPTKRLSPTTSPEPCAKLPLS